MKNLVFTVSCLLYLSNVIQAQENDLVGTWQGSFPCEGADQDALIMLRLGLKSSDSPYVYKYGFGSGYEEVENHRVDFDLSAHIYEDLSVHIAILPSSQDQTDGDGSGKKTVYKRLLLEFKKSDSGYILTGDWELNEKLFNGICRRGKVVLRKIKAKNKA